MNTKPEPDDPMEVKRFRSKVDPKHGHDERVIRAATVDIYAELERALSKHGACPDCTMRVLGEEMLLSYIMNVADDEAHGKQILLAITGHVFSKMGNAFAQRSADDVIDKATHHDR